MGSNKRMYLNDKWLILFFSVSVPKQRKPHEKHKAAGGREMQQYPVMTGSDLSSGSGARRTEEIELLQQATSTLSQRRNVS